MQRPYLVKLLRRSARRVRDAMACPSFTYLARRRLRHPGHTRPHKFPGELIVSLTSYPARFETLSLTLACLLDQSVRADRIILWIAYEDVAQLPSSVRLLERRGLEIRVCDDLRSFKKLVPTLESFPNAFIVTADDDLYFGRKWLAELADGFDPNRTTIVCHGAHRLKTDRTGRLAPYLAWELNVQDRRSRTPSNDIMPTGGAGALYPPGSLDPRVTDRGLFERLCPDGDDLWFYWCARMAGTQHKKVGGRVWPINWAGSQESSLWESNEHGGNDAAIAALEKEFGYPPCI